MGRHAQSGGVTVRAEYFWGPFTRFGVVVALIVCAIDQASKLWLLNVFDLANRGIVHLTPFVDFVLFHLRIRSFSFVCYVFNLVDAAIVAGVVGVLYEDLLAPAPQERSDPP